MGSLGIKLDQRALKDIASAQPEAIESFLLRLKDILEARKERMAGPSLIEPKGKSGMKNYNITVNDEDYGGGKIGGRKTSGNGRFGL